MPTPTTLAGAMPLSSASILNDVLTAINGWTPQTMASPAETGDGVSPTTPDQTLRTLVGEQTRPLATTAAVTAAAGPVTPTTPHQKPVFAGNSSIGAIKQGFSDPLRDKIVSGVQGVVIDIGSKGFTIQNGTTGIFVYVGQPPLQVFPGLKVATEDTNGSVVEVIGKVSDFRGNMAWSVTNLAQKQIAVLPDPAKVKIIAEAAAPKRMLIGTNGVLPKGDTWVSAKTQQVMRDKGITDGDMEHPDAPFSPDEDPLAFWWSHTDTLVEIETPVVVGPKKRGSLWVAPSLGQYTEHRTPHGGLLIGPGIDHPQRLKVSLGRVNADQRPAKVGDTFKGNLKGVLRYNASEGQFEVVVTEPVEVVEGPTKPESVPDVKDPDIFTYSSINAENYGGESGEVRRQTLADDIVDHYKAPLMIGLQEVQDDSAGKDDGTTSSKQNIADLCDRIFKKSGVRYQGVWIDPTNDTQGGKPGANIRPVYLIRKDIPSLTFKLRGNADPEAEGTIEVRDGNASLSLNPMNITDPSFAHTRHPLLVEVKFNGHSVIGIGNHLTSKRGDSNPQGRYQPAQLKSEAGRTEQGKIVNGATVKIETVDAEATHGQLEKSAVVMVSGDMNDHYFRQPMQALTGDNLTFLHTLFGKSVVWYSYNHDGISQDLDQIAGNKRAQEAVLEASKRLGRPAVMPVHINSEYPESDPKYHGRVQQSDHDGVWAALYLPRS